MTQDQARPNGPDLTLGIAIAELADGGKLIGHIGSKEVLLVREGTEIFAVGAPLHALRKSGGTGTNNVPSGINLDGNT